MVAKRRTKTVKREKKVKDLTTKVLKADQANKVQGGCTTNEISSKLRQ